MLKEAKEVWLALILGLPLLLFAWTFAFSRSLQRHAARNGAASQVPGSFWLLPLAGDTIEFLRAGDPDDFLVPRIKRYGPIFRTHLLGRPTVCVTTVEAVKFVLQSPRLFTNAFPTPERVLFGEHSIFHVEGEEHSRIRKIIHAPLFPEALKHFPAQVGSVVRGLFEEWGPAEVISCLEELKTVAAEKRDVLALFHQFEAGLMAVPLRLPGITYSKALIARDKIIAMLEKVIDERQAEKGSVERDDLLQAFLTWEKNSQKLSKSQIADNMLGIWPASHDTVAGTVSLVIRNFCLYPSLYQEILEEQDAIASAEVSASEPLTWDDLHLMPVTMRFVNETFRVHNPTSFGSKETHEDVMLNGMLIPKGWQVFVWPRMFHHNSQWYPDPYKFDPTRFSVQ